MDKVPSRGRVVQCGETAFRRFWLRLLEVHGLEADNYTPYSVRRGGATALFQATQSFSAVADRGRWNKEKTARLYIETALLQMRSRSEVDRSRLAEGARALQYFLERMPAARQ